MTQKNDPMLFERFRNRDILLLTVLSLTYVFISERLIGWQPEQFILIVLYNGCYFGTPLTRKLILGFSVFAVYWIIFDYMKAFPNYEFSTVHIRALYNAELSVFGIRYHDVVITPNEFWQLHTAKWLDVVSGIFYLCWIPVPLLFATFLFFRERREFLRFSITFLVVNFLGFILYYTYPAAPPWYFQEFGTTFHADTPGGIAGLARFDQFFGVGVFKSIYSKSSNVFAAMPSLHSAYPLVVLYFGLRTELGLANILLAAVTIGIWFAAVYTSHHYVLDVVMGIVCAGCGILLFNRLSVIDPFRRWLDQYLRQIV